MADCCACACADADLMSNHSRCSTGGRARDVGVSPLRVEFREVEELHRWAGRLAICRL